MNLSLCLHNTFLPFLLRKARALFLQEQAKVVKNSLSFQKKECQIYYVFQQHFCISTHPSISCAVSCVSYCKYECSVDNQGGRLQPGYVPLSQYYFYQIASFFQYSIIGSFLSVWYMKMHPLVDLRIHSKLLNIINDIHLFGVFSYIVQSHNILCCFFTFSSLQGTFKDTGKHVIVIILIHPLSSHQHITT